MEITQECLNEVVQNYLGEPYELTKETKLTLRLLLIEVILCKDENRSGDERIKGFALAQKVNTLMGIITLDDADIKLVETRMDKALIVTSQDFLYGTLATILKSGGVAPKDSA